MHRPRTGHAAPVMSDGKVLIAGGGDANSDSIEMFSPDNGVFVPLQPGRRGGRVRFHA
jgi:Kelch motif